MQLTAILLTACCLTAVASGTSQITLKVTDVPLKKVFQQIHAQSGYDIFYNGELVRSAGSVTVELTNVTLIEALDACLRGKPLSYTVSDKTVIIKEKPKVIVSGDEISAPPVSGIVRGPDGEPLPGVNVQVKGTSRGTTTDALGKFIIDANPGDKLVISSVGYSSQEIIVSHEPQLSVTLSISTSPLDEVQIIAYGQTSKRFQTGNVATVKAADIAKQPVANPLLALQGRVPGLFIEQATGMPGSGVTVRIQGQNSLSRGSDPLYVIDGVPYVSQMLLGLTNILGRSGGNPLSGDGNGNPLYFINPADIESIEVLKDADATSIYGSRAAAGAILITTKKGKAGKTKVDFTWQQGWGKVGNFVDLLNTQQYLEMRHEAKRNDNVAIGPTDYDINGTWDTTRYTDWQKSLIGGTAHYKDAQLSFSGGTATTTFLVNGGYHRETTVFPGDQHDQKSSLHVNVNHISPNQRFRLQVDGKFLVGNNHIISTDLTANAIQLAPNAPTLYDANGNLNWAPDGNENSTWTNPLAYLHQKYKIKCTNLIGNAILSYEPLPGLNVKSSLGYTNLTKNDLLTTPLDFYAPELRTAENRYSLFGSDNISSWIVEPQVTYKNKIRDGILEILLGTTLLENETNQQQIIGVGYNSDLVLEDLRAAPDLSTTKTTASVYRYNAIFGRVNYTWMNKYIVNLSARRDGSSRFGSNSLFNNFGSVAGAWIFSNEEFVGKALPFLSFGKLKASYGTTGSDQIGDYQFMPLYNIRNRIIPYQGVAGLRPNGLNNPYLQWEETRKLQIGTDLGLWADRILLTLTYFNNRSSNQLQRYALPLMTGNSGININFPAVIRNSGWEITLNTTNFQHDNFSWGSSLNLTIPSNKLVAYENLDKSTLASRYIIGQPFTLARLYHFLGVDPQTGLFFFEDNHGGPTSPPNYPTDAIVLVNTSPSWYGGLHNNLNYKGLSLDILFQVVKQRTTANYQLGDQPGSFRSNANSSIVKGNQPTSVLNRWQKPGDLSSFQRFSTLYPAEVMISYNNAFGSDINFLDASYIRLKNISISWQLPKSWKQKFYLENARLFAQGQNLLTITDYIGLDPESKSTNSIPPLRVWTIGIQVVF